MPEKILVFGAGWIGTKLSQKLNALLIPKHITDVCSAEQVYKALRLHKPTIVVNATGKTGSPNIDWCEDHKAETFYSNVVGPLVLRYECLKYGEYIHFVHLSSGCIFDRGRFDEYDEPNPVSYYAATKVRAEKELMLLSEQLPEETPLILRIRMPIDGTPHPRNLITKLAGYQNIIKVENSVTIVEDFLNVAATLIERRKRGIFNVTNGRPITHQRIMELYKEIVDPSHEYNLINPSKLYTKAGRSNCILNSSRLRRENISMRGTEEALIECLEKYKKYLKPNQ